MDYDAYREKYFTTPAPQARFAFAGLHGLTLFFAEYEAAVAYYQRVLGSPAYVEGASTRGWRLGNTWLTLLRGKNGSPQNIEMMVVMETPEEVDRLQAAFLEAGGEADPPTDVLMYEPVHSCSVRDPFGTNILIFSPLSNRKLR